MCKSVSGPIFGLCSEHLSVIFRSISFIRSQTRRNSFTSTKAEANLDVTRSIFVRSRQRSTTCPLSLPFGRGSRVNGRGSKNYSKLFSNYFLTSSIQKFTGSCLLELPVPVLSSAIIRKKNNLTVIIERAIF